MATKTLPWSALLVALAVGFSAGCVAEPADDDDMILASASGALTVELRCASHEKISRGENSLEITIRDRDDAGVDGLTVDLVALMPAMGHGGPKVPSPENLGDGVYRWDRIYFSMAGLWEIRLSLSGPVTDQVTFRVELD